MLLASTEMVGRSDEVSCPLMVREVLSDAKVQPSFGFESLETAISMLLTVPPEPMFSMMMMKRPLAAS